MRKKITAGLVKAMKDRDLGGKEILRFIKGEIARLEDATRILTDADIQLFITKIAENLEFASDDLSKLQLKYLKDNVAIHLGLNLGHKK